MAKTEIKSEISLNTTKFQRGLANSQQGINNFAKNAIAKFGAIAGAAGLGMLARSAIDLGSKISDMAVQMNIGTDQLQTLEFAAREAGVGVEIMARALRNVQLRTEEAINGNKSYGDAFVRLGINIQKFKKLSVEKKMEAIAIAQSKATDKAAAYNAVSRILGEKAGPALQEVLQKLAGPQGYGGLEAAAKRAGEVMSKETIAKMDAAADKIESFKRRLTVMAGEVLGKVMPAFSIFGNGLGSVGDITASLIGKFSSFLGFLGRSVSATIDPVIKQFQSLAEGLKGVALSFLEPAKASEAFKKSLSLQKGSVDSLLNWPKKMAAEYKRANEEMAIDNKMLDRSMKERAISIESAWAEMWGKNVKVAQKASKEIKNEMTGGAGGDADPIVEEEQVRKKKIEEVRESIKPDLVKEAEDGRIAGEVYSTAYFKEFKEQSKLNRSDELRVDLKAVGKQRKQARRFGNWDKDKELRDQESDLRRGIHEARGDERTGRLLARLGRSNESDGSSGRSPDAHQNSTVSDYHTKSIELQTSIKDLMEPVSKHYAENSNDSLQRDSFQSQIDLYKLAEIQSEDIKLIVTRLDKLDQALR